MLDPYVAKHCLKLLSQVRRRVEEEAGPAPRSAEAVARLHRHFNEASKWLDEEAKALDHPQLRKALERFRASHIEPALEHLEKLFEEHHGGRKLGDVLAGLDGGDGSAAWWEEGWGDHEDQDA